MNVRDAYLRYNTGKLRRNTRKGVYLVLHVLMLALSVFLIVSISIDTFHGDDFFNTPRFVHVQTMVCAFFLFDFFAELVLAERKWHYLATHFMFFLVSIPYSYIIYRMHWQFPPNVVYLLQYIPLVRGGYALAFVVGWFTYNRATGIFVTYLVTLMATVYFGSLVFYMFEREVNPGITCYQDALWWACMDTTTVGSSIDSITPVGRVIAVLLAALGMMMFPIFTVYVTSIITRRRKEHPVLFNAARQPGMAGSTDCICDKESEKKD